MSNRKPLFDLQWMRWQELVLTTLVGWIPLPPGRALRRLAYRTILSQMGSSVRIEPQVEIVYSKRIEIGNKVKIDRGVCLRNYGQDSRICLGDYVQLDVGVIIKTHLNASIIIGDYTYIGPYSSLSGSHIKIGKDCRIASHSGIYANNHNFADSTRKIKEQGNSYKGIVIEDDCWLGSGVKVLDGVTIGQGSVIGAGAVVTKDIPPYSVAVGVPAHTIKSRSYSELINSTPTKEYTCKDGSRLPIPLSTALTKFEETAELTHAKVEETTKLSLQRLLKDFVPAQSTLQNLLHPLLDCIRQTMNVDTIAVLLRVEEGQQLAVRATLGLEEEITEGIRIPLGRGFAGRIVANCKVTIVDDLSKVEVVSPILHKKGLQSMLGVPLLVKNEVIGVFHVGTLRPRHFKENDAQVLQLVADHMGSIIARLAILKLFTVKEPALVREKFALTCFLQSLIRQSETCLLILKGSTLVRLAQE